MKKVSETTQPLLTSTECAKLIGWSENHLRRVRSQGGDSPEYIPVGRFIMYELSDIEKWKQARKKRPVLSTVE